MLPLSYIPSITYLYNIIAASFSHSFSFLPPSLSFSPPSPPPRGVVSSPYVCEIVESADVYLFAGPMFNGEMRGASSILYYCLTHASSAMSRSCFHMYTSYFFPSDNLYVLYFSIICLNSDYTSCGYSTLLKKGKMIQVDPYRVTVCGGQAFGCVVSDPRLFFSFFLIPFLFTEYSLNPFIPSLVSFSSFRSTLLYMVINMSMSKCIRLYLRNLLFSPLHPRS
jgi:hypothetical protein